jgi:hypothetical protein
MAYKTTATRVPGAAPLWGINIFIICAMMLFIAPAQAQTRSALFWGITDAAGQPALPELEQAVRNAFSIMPKFRLIDPLETERILREKDRLGHGGIDNSIPQNFKLSDSTIIIRGIVAEFSMNLKRHLLLWGKIEARAVVKFHFSDLAGGSAYDGEFSANAKKIKDLVLFASPKRVIHISAVDRSELMGAMQSQIVKELSDFATLYFNSLASGADSDTADKKDLTPETEAETAADSQAVSPQAEKQEDADFSEALGDDKSAIDDKTAVNDTAQSQ